MLHYRTQSGFIGQNSPLSQQWVKVPQTWYRTKWQLQRWWFKTLVQLIASRANGNVPSRQMGPYIQPIKVSAAVKRSAFRSTQHGFECVSEEEVEVIKKRRRDEEDKEDSAKWGATTTTAAESSEQTTWSSLPVAVRRRQYECWFCSDLVVSSNILVHLYIVNFNLDKDDNVRQTHTHTQKKMTSGTSLQTKNKHSSRHYNY